jgi:hypothetical protein
MSAKLNDYQIRQLKKIGFKDGELNHFSPQEAQRTIKSFYQMSRGKRFHTMKDMKKT